MKNRASLRMPVDEQEGLASASNRREEIRVEDCHACSYEILGPGELSAEGAQQSQAFTLNRSAHGRLLLMGQAPRLNQRIEVHSTTLGWWRSTMIYDVRWTQSIQIGPQGDLFLVGCRLAASVPL
ncbi:MAG: hypothetical protein IT389_14615 [Nitrospira sp.]|nr:hypothetical protein [Nitrospira sp.]